MCLQITFLDFLQFQQHRRPIKYPFSDDPDLPLGWYINFFYTNYPEPTSVFAKITKENSDKIFFSGEHATYNPQPYSGVLYKKSLLLEWENQNYTTEPTKFQSQCSITRE